MVNKKKLWGVSAIILVLVCIVLLLSTIGNVQKGTYDIVQYPTGTVRAVTTPGPYLKLGGSVVTWPMSDTFYFTSDSEGGKGDYSIKVQFRDGSFAQISGTTRVNLPSNPELAINLMTEQNYKSFSDLEDRLIMPVVRAAFIRTANLMSAQESYNSKRADFINWTWDQVENGLYRTKERVIDVPRIDDPTRMEKRSIREIVYNEDGTPQREKNPLDGLGIRLSNFEVKAFEYDPVVVKQIADQQANLMAIETAKAQAERAKQDAIKAEEEGKARAATAKWQQEEINAKQIAEAEKELAVAKLAREAAEQTKQQQILLGQGEAERKRLVMQADGALELKLKAYVATQEAYANALKGAQLVPGVVMGNGSSNTNATNLIDLLAVKAAKDLQLDFTMKK